MKRVSILAVVALLAALVPPPAAHAQSEAPARLSGSAQIGFRAVDVGGRTEKYREDINLEDGPRLFKLQLSFVPPADFRGALDKLDVDFQNLGGDPFESFHVVAKKSGRYSLKYDRHKSSYFYDDVILPPELGSSSLSNAGDLHKLDFDRVRDLASLRIQLSKAARFSFGFDRFTKKGNSTTTFDIQRDEFEFDQPIDESMNEYQGAFEYTTRKLTLAFEERVRKYDNAVEIFLPGRSGGEDLQDPAVLDLFFLDRPYSFTGYTHTGRLLLHPNERLTLKAAASLNDLDLETTVSERSEGLGFNGSPFTTEVDGAGSIERQMNRFDLDVSYTFTPRVTFVAGVRRHEFEQTGAIDLAGAEGGSSAWDTAITSAEAGLQVLAAPDVSLSGGIRHASRDVTASRVQPVGSGSVAGDTRNTGGYLSLGWRPSRRLRITAGYEDGSYDGPFTLASPTGQRIIRFRGQYGGGEGFSLSASGRVNRTKNDDSGWRADTDHYNVRLGYRLESFSLSLGYSRVELALRIDQQVAAAATRLLVPVNYDVTANNVDGRLIWSFTEGWRVGGQLRFYDSDGSFSLNRRDLRGWLEVELGERYVAHLGFRGIDYEETLRSFDDYDARIAEVSIGYRW